MYSFDDMVEIEFSIKLNLTNKTTQFIHVLDYFYLINK